MKLTLNIGMALGDTGHQLTLAQVVQVLEPMMPVTRLSIVESDTERTVVASVQAELATVELAAALLGQDCIAAFDGVQGYLLGPNADAWGEFDPLHFFTHYGHRMSAVQSWVAAE